MRLSISPKFPVALLSSTHLNPSLPPTPIQTSIDLLSVTRDECAFSRVSYKWSHKICTLSIWLLALSILTLRDLYTSIVCIYVCVCVCVCVCMYACVCSFSHSVVSNSFAALWTIAHQARLSVGFSRQEYWTRLPFPTPEDLADPGIKPALCLLHL